MAPPRVPCTVQLLTRNSAKTVGRCLETLTAFAEVIVQDGYSTDGTRELVQKFPNARILDQDRRYLDAEGRITDFGSLRNESIKAARHEWLLVVDADEVVTEKMVEEVREIVNADVPGVYQAFRRFFVDGVPVVFAAGYPVYQIRLFHRSQVEGYEKPVHERLKLKPGVKMQILKSELPVPLPPAYTLKAKYHRYLRMEVRRLGVIPYGRWFKWVFLRNLRSVIGLSIRIVMQYLIPRRGKRMPLSHEWSFIVHSLRTIVATFPPVAARSLKNEQMASQTSSH